MRSAWPGVNLWGPQSLSFVSISTPTPLAWQYSRANVGHDVVNRVQTRLIRASVTALFGATVTSGGIPFIRCIINEISRKLAAVCEGMLQPKPMANLVRRHVVVLRGDAGPVGSHYATVVDHILLRRVGDGEFTLSTGYHVSDEEEVQVLVASLAERKSEIVLIIGHFRAGVEVCPGLVYNPVDFGYLERKVPGFEILVERVDLTLHTLVLSRKSVLAYHITGKRRTLR